MTLTFESMTLKYNQCYVDLWMSNFDEFNWIYWYLATRLTSWTFCMTVFPIYFASLSLNYFPFFIFMSRVRLKHLHVIIMIITITIHAQIKVKTLPCHGTNSTLHVCRRAMSWGLNSVSHHKLNSICLRILSWIVVFFPTFKLVSWRR